MDERESPEAAIVRRTVAGPSVSKYDLVAAAIPAAYLVIAGPAVAAGVSVRLALAAASLVAAAVMGYALFVDPPVDPDASRPTGSADRSAPDTTDGRGPVTGRSNTP